MKVQNKYVVHHWKYVKLQPPKKIKKYKISRFFLCVIHLEALRSLNFTGLLFSAFHLYSQAPVTSRVPAICFQTLSKTLQFT